MFKTFLIILSSFIFYIGSTSAEDLIVLEKIADNLTKPVFMTHADDQSERLFIIEKPGVVKIFKEEALLPTPFLDIQDRVFSVWETGLLSIAFHPDYIDNGRFFVYYTARTGEDLRSVIAEYGVSADNMDVAKQEERIILEIAQPTDVHNAGQLQFGPDGFLYISLGDGGPIGDGNNNGQNKDTLLSSVLRIDIDGDEPFAIPPDNPFVDTEGADEIWAYGFRNPWRFSFDRETGRLFLGDVGSFTIEEINIVEKGKNYGWKVMEGTECFLADSCNRNGKELPIHQYFHTEEEGTSVTGGYVYRGTDLPELFGLYLFGDFASSRIWALSESSPNVWVRKELIKAEFLISSFGEDEQGEIYVADHDGGVVYKIVDAEPIIFPVPTITITPTPTPTSTPSPAPSQTPAPTASPTITPTPTPTPDISSKEFTITCNRTLSDGIAGFKRLTLNKGETEACTLKMNNVEPGSQTKVVSNIMRGLRSSIKVDPAEGTTDANGEFAFTISAERPGFDWAIWTIDEGLSAGIVVEVNRR